jgi:chromate reductase, NAD(P)H dehydrogenase (quinone)
MSEKIILGIAGSLQPNSSNVSLLKAIGRFAPSTVKFILFQDLDKLTFFNPSQTNAAPDTVNEFRAQVKEAHGVIICTPEYAYGIPGALKNALDWIVSSGDLVDKPVVTISASPSPMGGEKAHASLRLTLTALSANLIEGGSLTIPAMRRKMDEFGNVTDEGTNNDLKNLLNGLLLAMG